MILIFCLLAFLLGIILSTIYNERKKEDLTKVDKEAKLKYFSSRVNFYMMQLISFKGLPSGEENYQVKGDIIENIETRLNQALKDYKEEIEKL